MFLFGSPLKPSFPFLKFCFRLEILTFLSLAVSFLSYIFKQKVVLLVKKTPVVEFETYFCSENVKVSRGKVLKENTIAGTTWSPVK